MDDRCLIGGSGVVPGDQCWCQQAPKYHCGLCADCCDDPQCVHPSERIGSWLVRSAARRRRRGDATPAICPPATTPGDTPFGYALGAFGDAPMDPVEPVEPLSWTPAELLREHWRMSSICLQTIGPGVYLTTDVVPRGDNGFDWGPPGADQCVLTVLASNDSSRCFPLCSCRRQHFPVQHRYLTRLITGGESRFQLLTKHHPDAVCLHMEAAVAALGGCISTAPPELSLWVKRGRSARPEMTSWTEANGKVRTLVWGLPGCRVRVPVMITQCSNGRVVCSACTSWANGRSYNCEHKRAWRRVVVEDDDDAELVEPEPVEMGMEVEPAFGTGMVHRDAYAAERMRYNSKVEQCRQLQTDRPADWEAQYKQCLTQLKIAWNRLERMQRRPVIRSNGPFMRLSPSDEPCGTQVTMAIDALEAFGRPPTLRVPDGIIVGPRTHCCCGAVESFQAPLHVRVQAAVDAVKWSASNQAWHSGQLLICMSEILNHSSRPPLTLPRLLPTRCPSGHVLEPEVSGRDLTCCDSCESSVPTGAPTFRCRTCDYNFCAGCFEAVRNLSAPTPSGDSDSRAPVSGSGSSTTTAGGSCTLEAIISAHGGTLGGDGHAATLKQCLLATALLLVTDGVITSGYPPKAATMAAELLRQSTLLASHSGTELSLELAAAAEAEAAWTQFSQDHCLCGAFCRHCGASARGATQTTRPATLHTFIGPMPVQLGSWACLCCTKPNYGRGEPYGVQIWSADILFDTFMWHSAQSNAYETGEPFSYMLTRLTSTYQRPATGGVGHVCEAGGWRRSSQDRVLLLCSCLPQGTAHESTHRLVWC